MQKQTRIAVVLCLFAVALMSLGLGTAGAAPKKGGHLTYAMTGSPSSLNPVIISGLPSYTVTWAIFDPLVTADPETLEIKPALASSWDFSADGLVWTFRLRNDVKWHDGKPFTAKDVKFTLESVVDPKVNSRRMADFEAIDKVVVVDAHTAKIFLKQPYAPLLGSLGMLGIVPEHALAGKDMNTADFNRVPIGTGPYKFVKWLSGDRIVVRANHEYWDGDPNIEEITFRIIPDANTILAQLLSGQIDIADAKPANLEMFEKNPKFEVYSCQVPVYYFLALDLRQPRFQDKRVREAIVSAVDRNKIVEKVLKGYGSVAESHYPPYSWVYNPKVPQCPYDPARAKKLLAEAGWHPGSDGMLQKDGKRFAMTIEVDKGDLVREQVAVILQSYLKDIGINAQVKVYEWSTFVDRMINNKYEDSFFCWWALGIDPDYQTYRVFHSSQMGNGYNNTFYQNPTVDKLLDEARRLTDPAQRKERYQALAKVLAEDVAQVFLYWEDNLLVADKRIKGIKPSPMNRVKSILWNIQDWYIE